MKKRIISLLMALALCLSLLPTAALAAEGEPTEQPVEQEQLKPVEPAPAEPEEGAPVEDAEEEEKEELPEEQEQEQQEEQDAPALLLAAAPRAVEGETHSHPICGDKDCTTHGKETWTAVSALSEIKVAGKYYLTQDVTLTDTWKPANVFLCLNGHKITGADGKAVIELSIAAFTLTDCKGTGKITHASGGTGCGVYISGGTFNMYGGSITGNTATDGRGRGGGVYVTSGGGAFKMFGGSITGNKATDGGGVYKIGSNSTFTMTGGSITGNTADDSGGGVYVNGGSFTMSGGSITGNKADGTGGGVCVNYDGTFNMSNNSCITGNTAYHGGGVYVARTPDSNNYKPGNFAMSSGTIGGTTTNDANQAQYGGGVYVAGAFTLTGGSITGNKTKGNGGGVYVNADSTFTVSGAPKITNNTQKTTTSSNVYLTEGPAGKPGAVITIAGKLEDDAKIGVTLTNNYGDNAFTSGWNAKMSSKAPSDYFIFDVGGKGFELSGGEVKLSDGHSHYLCGGSTCNGSGHEKETSKTTFAKEIRQENGKLYIGDEEWKVRDDRYWLSAGTYYLGTDITPNHKIRIDGDVTLCLNGKSITAGYSQEVIYAGKNFTLTDCANTSGTITHNGSNTGSGVITNGIFTMYNGNITGNSVSGGGGGVFVYGTFTMYGGSISGNNANWGGGVYINSGCTFTMYGGNISGNSAANGGGVYLDRNGKFTMSGGSITGNNANYGGGVNVNGDFYVSGSIQIKDNVKGGTKNENGKYTGGTANNVYILAHNVICIGTALTDGAEIGVTLDSNFGESTFTSGWGNTMSGKTPADYFTSDVDGYEAKLYDTELKLVSTHVHSWTYTTNGATITAMCGDNSCTSKDGGSITIKAPTELVYSGSGKAATLTESNWQGGDVTIAYKQGDKTLSGVPTNAGTYTASITLGGATASVEYTIAKATPSVSGSGTATGTYGQKLSEVAVNGLTAKLGEKTVEGRWALTDNTSDTLDTVTLNGSTTEYTAVFTPTDTDNYNSTTAKVAVTVNPKAGGSLGTVNLTQKFTDTAEKTYTPNWAGLPAGERWSYVSDMTTSNGGITLNKNDFDADGKKLIYSISGGQVNDTVTFTLKAFCADNHYEPFTITVVVKLTDKDTPTVKANNINVTYTGADIPASAITGTATFDNASVAGTWSWKSTAPKNVADSGNHTVVFTPADSANYSSVEAIITVTIAKATPTGEPKYTKITAGGKTLADAGLTVTGSTLNPNAGDLVWVDGAGNALPGTTVVEKNTTYKWRFTPNDANYEALTGSVELYHVSGGYYYYYTPAAGGTTDANKSPRTGDAGLLVYGLTALSSYTGTALVLRRKRED